MIPIDKVKKIIEKHHMLEKELSTGKVDPKLLAKKSKEYSDLKNIVPSAKQYIENQCIALYSRERERESFYDSQFLRECSVSIEEDFSEKCYKYLVDLVGGERKYNKITKWADNNLPEEEIDKFNDAIDSGNAAEIQRLILELNQKYLNSKYFK